HWGIDEFQTKPRDTTTPFHLRPDLRFPTPSMDPDNKNPTTLLSPDGEYTAHLLCLLHPSSTRLQKLLNASREARTATLDTVYPEDLISRALASQKLQHVSDGPKGGIWLVEEGNVEVVVAMVEELEGCKEERMAMGKGCGVEEDQAGGKWEVLGLGRGGDEGRVFLRHGCGSGPRVLEEEVKKKVEGKGKGVGNAGGGGKGKKRGWVGRFLDKM
ncbi:MAG: hypothetical protein Q9169_008203, partial [Polycauliona sp. 2 TL-2023]